MALLINILLGFYVFIALLMVLVILMQRPKSEGLGAAFGGGVTENIFGAQTTNVLTKITSWLATVFFLLTFVLSILYAQKGNNTQSELRRELLKDLPATTPTASPAPGSTPAVATDLSPTPASTSAGATETPATPSPAPAAAPDTSPTPGVDPSSSAVPATTGSATPEPR